MGNNVYNDADILEGQAAQQFDNPAILEGQAAQSLDNPELLEGQVMGDTTPTPAQGFGGFSIGQQPMRNLAQPFGVIGNAVKHLLGEKTDEEIEAEEKRREWKLKE